MHRRAMLHVLNPGACWCRDGSKVGGQVAISMGLFWGGRVLEGILNRNVDARKHELCAHLIPQTPRESRGLGSGVRPLAQHPQLGRGPPPGPAERGSRGLS